MSSAVAEDVNRSDLPSAHGDLGIKPFRKGWGTQTMGFFQITAVNKAKSSQREVETKVGLLENASKDHSLKQRGGAQASTEPSACVHGEGGSRTPAHSAASPYTRKHRTDKDGIPVYPEETLTAQAKLEANMTVGIGEERPRLAQQKAEVSTCTHKSS